MSVPAEPQVVRIKDVADIATAIPHMLGFRPTRSLVAVALRRPRDRMSFTMRLDLLPAGHDVEVAQDVAMRMRHARADAMLLVLYTARGDRATLPRDPLVRAVARASSVPMRDALLVDDGRVWSYLCDDVRCCPPEGRLLDAESPGATALAAAHALQGDVILPDRDALVATTRAIGGIAAESMAQAQERVVARLLADAPASLDVERSLLVLDEIAQR